MAMSLAGELPSHHEVVLDVFGPLPKVRGGVATHGEISPALSEGEPARRTVRAVSTLDKLGLLSGPGVGETFFVSEEVAAVAAFYDDFTIHQVVSSATDIEVGTFWNLGDYVVVFVLQTRWIWMWTIGIVRGLRKLWLYSRARSRRFGLL